MTDQTPSHGALKLLADFRDHLARHDKPIAFFFGAGTSCAVRVPSKADAAKSESLVPAVAALTAIAKQMQVLWGHPSGPGFGQLA